jgi:hypothetical protein
MGENEVKEEDERKENWLYFKEKAKKHWILGAIVIASCIIAFIYGFVLIRNLFVDDIIGSQGITHIQDFSTGSLLGGTIYIFLMYFAIIGLPTFGFLGAVVAIYWFYVLSEEEKTELKEWSKSKKEKAKERRKWKERHGEQAGEFGGIVGLGMMIKIAVDGNWLVTFENLLLIYLFEVWIIVISWLMIIFGIPMLIIFILVIFYRDRKKEQID